MILFLIIIIMVMVYNNKIESFSNHTEYYTLSKVILNKIYHGHITPWGSPGCITCHTYRKKYGGNTSCNCTCPKNHFQFKNMKSFTKTGIWNTLKSKLGESGASELYPRSFLLPNDTYKIVNSNESGKYILKKENIGAKKGLKIVDNKKDVLKNILDYDMAQLIVPNPHLINGFKYDIRMFIILHYKYGILLFKEGYFTYSNQKYSETSKDMFSLIGASHLEEKFFIDNQLPTRGSTYKHYDIIYGTVERCLKKIFKCYSNPIFTPEEIKMKKIRIYGADINIFKNKNGHVYCNLIEMNSSPYLLFEKPYWKTKIIFEMLFRLEYYKNNKSYFTLLQD
jgi:hypothetical protein